MISPSPLGAARRRKASTLPLVIRTLWGAALLVAPGLVLRFLGGVDEGRAPRRVLRTLGVRHLIQGAAEAGFGAAARRVGIVVDVVHAATDVGFACVDRRWRRAATTDAVITTGLVLLGVTNP